MPTAPVRPRDQNVILPFDIAITSNIINEVIKVDVNENVNYKTEYTPRDLDGLYSTRKKSRTTSRK